MKRAVQLCVRRLLVSDYVLNETIMKTTITILIVLVFTTCAFGQAKKSVAPKDYVQLVITDDGATSELLPMPIAMSPNLSGAEIGIKYFGVQSENDISFVLILKGTRNRYSASETFGVKLYSDDIPLSKNKYRVVDSIDKAGGGETLHFYLTTEDLAWLATASSVKIEIYNTETDKRYDTFSFTQAGFSEFKRFVKSVLLIRSQFN